MDIEEQGNSKQSPVVSGADAPSKTTTGEDGIIAWCGEVGIYLGYMSVLVAIVGILMSWQAIQPLGLVLLFGSFVIGTTAMIIALVIAGVERAPISD